MSQEINVNLSDEACAKIQQTLNNAVYANPVTGRKLLEALKRIDETSPQKLDEPLFATYGNDENGNADIIPIQALLPAYDDAVNGIPNADCSISQVVVLDDEGKESVIDLMEEVIGMLEQCGVTYMMQEDYERFQEIKAKAKEIREGMNSL
mgnify:CR=1 FL=1|jgi:hypothetical protein